MLLEFMHDASGDQKHPGSWMLQAGQITACMQSQEELHQQVQIHLDRIH